LAPIWKIFGADLQNIFGADLQNIFWERFAKYMGLIWKICGAHRAVSEDAWSRFNPKMQEIFWFSCTSTPTFRKHFGFHKLRVNPKIQENLWFSCASTPKFRKHFRVES
jgi:hypothetical protein